MFIHMQMAETAGLIAKSGAMGICDLQINIVYEGPDAVTSAIKDGNEKGVAA